MTNNARLDDGFEVRRGEAEGSRMDEKTRDDGGKGRAQYLSGGGDDVMLWTTSEQQEEAVNTMVAGRAAAVLLLQPGSWELAWVHAYNSRASSSPCPSLAEAPCPSSHGSLSPPDTDCNPTAALFAGYVMSVTLC